MENDIIITLTFTKHWNPYWISIPVNEKIQKEIQILPNKDEQIKLLKKYFKDSYLAENPFDDMLYKTTLGLIEWTEDNTIMKKLNIIK